jgi:hypothetical protein
MSLFLQEKGTVYMLTCVQMHEQLAGGCAHGLWEGIETEGRKERKKNHTNSWW